MAGELTIEILQEAMRQSPLEPRRQLFARPKSIRISYGDYQRMRESCDALKICLEQPGGYTLGIFGERITPSDNIPDNHYEIVRE